MEQAIILAAGCGLRLNNGVTGGLPKCLVEVGGKPLIKHNLELLASVGIDSICVVVGYEAEKVCSVIGDSCTCAVENPEYAETNSLYSFWLCTDWISQSVTVMNCDVLVHPAIVHRVLAANGSAFAYDSSRGGEEEDMKVSLTSGMLRTMSKELALEETDGENVGLLHFDKETARQLCVEAEMVIRSGRRKDWFPRAVVRSARHLPIRGIDIAGLPWTEIDFPEDLEFARKRIWPAICEGERQVPVESKAVALSNAHRTASAHGLPSRKLTGE